MVDTRDLCELFDKRETPFFFDFAAYRHTIGLGDVSICQRSNLSALSEKRDVECRKFKETIAGKADGNLEPSLRKEEGAETRHDTPKGPRRPRHKKSCDIAALFAPNIFDRLGA